VSKAAASRDLLKSMLPEPLGEQLEPHARLITARRGQILLSFGDSSSDVYLLLGGRLRIELHPLSGREVILADVGPGAIVGEMAALDEQPRSATVLATSDCTLALLPGSRFREAVFASPETAQWMARRLVSRIRLLTEKIFELNALAVRNRLHCELLRMCLEVDISGNRAVIEPSPTHAELAGRIGTHREAVTRELQYLAGKEIIAQERRQLVVTDVAEIARMVRAAAGDVDMIYRAAEMTVAGS
jgi:CRP/FNR family transcriptional regulator, cyclic AMP receptor protein